MGLLNGILAGVGEAMQAGAQMSMKEDLLAQAQQMEIEKEKRIEEARRKNNAYDRQAEFEFKTNPANVQADIDAQMQRREAEDEYKKAHFGESMRQLKEENAIKDDTPLNRLREQRIVNESRKMDMEERNGVIEAYSGEIDKLNEAIASGAVTGAEALRVQDRIRGIEAEIGRLRGGILSQPTTTNINPASGESALADELRKQMKPKESQEKQEAAPIGMLNQAKPETKREVPRTYKYDNKANEEINAHNEKVDKDKSNNEAENALKYGSTDEDVNRQIKAIKNLSVSHAEKLGMIKRLLGDTEKSWLSNFNLLNLGN